MGQKAGEAGAGGVRGKAARGGPSFRLGAAVIGALAAGELLRAATALSALPPLSLSPLLVALTVHFEPRSAFASGKRGSVVAPLWLAFGWAPAIGVASLWLLDSWFQRPAAGSPDDLARGSSLLPFLIFAAVAAVGVAPPLLSALVGPDRPLWARSLGGAARAAFLASVALVVVEGARLAIALSPEQRARALSSVPLEGDLRSLKEMREVRPTKAGEPVYVSMTFGAIFVSGHCVPGASAAGEPADDALVPCDLHVAPPGAKVSQVSRDVRADVRYGEPVHVRFVAWANLWVLEQRGRALAAFRGHSLEPTEIGADDLSGAVVPPRAWLGLAVAGLLLVATNAVGLRARERALARLVASKPGRMTESGVIELDDGSGSFRPRAGEEPDPGPVAVLAPPAPSGYRDEAMPEVSALRGSRAALVDGALEALSSRYALIVAQIAVTSAPLLASAVAKLLL